MGDDPARIEAYLGGLEHEIGRQREPYRDVRRHGTGDQLAALNKRIDEARWHYEDERYRLRPDVTEMHSVEMTVVGSVLTVLGVLSGIAAPIVTFSLEYLPFMSILAGTGFAAIGIPMIAVGADQVPFEPADRAGGPGPVVLRAGPSGLTLTGSF